MRVRASLVRCVPVEREDAFRVECEVANEPRSTLAYAGGISSGDEDEDTRRRGHLEGA